MKEIAVVTSGFLPVPNVLGGAVEALEMTVLDENEKEGKAVFRVYSIWNDEAFKKSRHYLNTRYHFIKTPTVIALMDNLIYRVVRKLALVERTTTYRYLIQRTWFIFRVARDLRNNPADAILVEDHPVLFNCLRLFGNRKRYRGRVYYHLHRDFTRDFGQAKLIADSKRVIGVSQFTIDSLASFLKSKNGIELDADQSRVVKNSVDLNRFNSSDGQVIRSAREMRMSLGIPLNSCVVAFSGRLTPEKGVEELIKAFLRLKNPNVRLVIAGSHFYGTGTKSSFEERLWSLVEQDPERICFTGYLDYESMPAFYAMADIMCAPSLCEDAAPMAIVEALASGRPVVATRAGGIPEYAPAGTSVLIDRGEGMVDRLAEALEALIASEDTRIEMSARGIARMNGLDNSSYYASFINALDVPGNSEVG